MYSSIISHMPFTEADADVVLGNIRQSGTYREDKSLLNTVRALLYPRIENDEKISIFIYNFINSPRFEAIFEDVEGHKKDLTLCIGPMSEEFYKAAEAAKNWREPEDLKLFVQKTEDTSKIRIFLNETDRKTVITAPAMTPSAFHFLNIMVPRYFPWYFESKPINEDERNYLKEFAKISIVQLNSIASKLLQATDIQLRINMNRIRGLVYGMQQRQLEARKNEVDRARNEANNLLRRYRDALAAITEASIAYQGYKIGMKNDSNDSELVDYLASNKNVEIVGVDGNHLKVVVSGYLNLVDSDCYEEYAENTDSYLYEADFTRDGVFEDDEEARMKLLDALFSSSPKCKLRTCGYYDLNLAGDVQTLSGYRFSPKYNDYLPNPHLNEYACLGENAPVIAEALSKSDIVSALEQCCVSVASLNICEDCTVNRLCSRLFTTNAKCIEMPDGRQLTPAEAVKEL